MKKRLLILLAICLFATGCGKNPKPSNEKEAVVEFKNGDKITVDELYEQIKTTYGLDGLITLSDKYVLEKSFSKYSKEAKTLADDQIKQLRSGYNSDEELLNLLRQIGFASIDSYKDTIYINYMSKHAEKEYAKTLVTDKDIEAYYKDNVEGDIEVSHILITSSDAADEENAKKEAENVLKTLKETSKDKLTSEFSKLAKEKSEDDATKDNGGSLGKINKQTLSSSYDQLVEAAYSIKDNELYNKVVKTELGYHVIMRTKSYDKPSLKKEKDNILTTLAEEKINQDSTISTKAMQYYRKKQGMEIKDSDLKTQYANYIQGQLFQNN